MGQYSNDCLKDDVLAVALKGPHLVSASADGTIKVLSIKYKNLLILTQGIM